MSYSSKMTLFFTNKGFYSRLSLDTSQLTNSQNAHNFAKHMDDILEHLRINLLMFQKNQTNIANFHWASAFSY